MRSAQRRHRIESKARNGVYFLFIKILIIPVFLIVVYLFFKLSTKYWDGTNKISYAYRLSSGDVAVTVDDPKLGEENTLVIPGDTQVDVAENLGTFRIKNVWQLSINEKTGGKLLPETLTKDFLFPTFLWSDGDAASLMNNDFFGILKFIIAPTNTNIPLGDRFNMGIFAMQVGSLDKTEINLGDSKFVQKTTLNDGQTGYVISGPVSQRLTVYFADNDFSDENLKVGIIDSTGTPGVADNVGQVIQVLGGKVVSIDKKPAPSATDCIVMGKDAKTVAKIANLFSCKKSGGSTTFDLEIDLGANFAKRF